MIIVKLLRSHVLLYGSNWQLPPLEKTAAVTFFHTVLQKHGANKEAVGRNFKMLSAAKG